MTNINPTKPEPHKCCLIDGYCQYKRCENAQPSPTKTPTVDVEVALAWPWTEIDDTLPAHEVRATILNKQKKNLDQIYAQKFLEVIGKDDRDYSQDNADAESLKILVATLTACNELRAELREAIKKELQ